MSKINETLKGLIPAALQCKHYGNDDGLAISGDDIYRSPAMGELAEKLKTWLDQSKEAVLWCSSRDFKEVMNKLEWLKQAFSRQHKTIGIDLVCKLFRESPLEVIEKNSYANDAYFVQSSNLPVRIADGLEGSPDVPEGTVNAAAAQRRIRIFVQNILDFQKYVLQNRKNWTQRNCVIL